MTAQSKKRILVVGGAGYIGSIMCPALLDAGYSVTVLDSFLHRMNSLALCCANPAFNVFRGDCRDERLMRDLLKNADIVVPLAAIVGAPSSTRDQIATVSVNRDAVVMLVKLLSPTQQIVYPMTNSSYGTGEAGKTCTEDTPFLPISLYASTKVEAEIAILSHPNAISVRLATVFGMSPRMRIDLLVNDFVYRAVKDRAVVIFEGHFRRSYVHIRDVASVFLHCMEHFDAMRGRPYNLGLDKANLSKIELCQLIQQKIPEFVFLEAPIGEDPDQRNYVVSSARLHSTGFFPSYSLAQGIDELLKGYTTLSNSVYGNV